MRLIAATMGMVIMLSSCVKPTQPDPTTPIATYSPPVVDRSNIVELEKLIGDRLLRANDLPFAGRPGEQAERVLRIGHQLQHACNAKVPTDERMVTNKTVQFHSVDGQMVVDEAMFAYDQPVGAIARDEADSAITCKSYRQLDRVFEQIDITAHSAQGTLSFCERVTPDRSSAAATAWLCTTIVGQKDFACSVRVWSAEKQKAIAARETLSGVVLERCRRSP